MNTTKQNKPNKLFHYTTQEGLMGILKDKSLWATKIQYLNDASEVTKPVEIAIAMFEKALPSMSVTKNSRKALTDYARKEFDKWKDINLCVASFCVKGDLLSQWRGYGAYGLAYSIGFDREKLEKTISKYKFELRRCEYYTEKGYNQAVDDFIVKAAAKALHSRYKGPGFMQEFIKMTANMKLKCFKGENEWRIISSQPVRYTDSNFMFRTAKSMIIPYYKLPLNISSIIEIIIGPCQHPGLAKSAVSGLASKYGLTNLAADSIKMSAIPYRVF
jgi:hypothetical protein